MAKYILAYRGGREPSSPEEGAAQRRRFNDWMSSIRESLVSPANPVGPSKLIDRDGVRDGGGALALTGYTIIEASDEAAALELARRCPFTEIGTIELAKMVELGGC